MRAARGTALYDAIDLGVEMTDAAQGEANAIRGVVVLTDGKANKGVMKLDNLILMSTMDEVSVSSFTGFENSHPIDINGRNVAGRDVTGTEMRLETRFPIQIFFIGIGDDADMEVGRLLAEASGAEFQGVAEKDLAEVLEEYSKYF